MRSDVELRLGPGDRERLERVVADRKSSQKHVWRARIILATAESYSSSVAELSSSSKASSIWSSSCTVRSERWP